MASSTASDGTTLAWARQGSNGPTLLFVHGITESSASWDPIVARLKDDAQCVTMDLRGHGNSAKADDYGLAAMAGDVITVASAIGDSGDIHLVGHSLGGAVVTAAAAAFPFASVTNVDQSLQLAGFRDQLLEVEPMLRSAEAFPVLIEQLFAGMAGQLAGAELDRVNTARSADQEVVLGVWELLLTSSPEEIDATVAGALAGYQERPTPYVALFGSDPGSDYAPWLADHIPGSAVELWPDMGHYPHLVDPDRFVQRLRQLWA